MKMFLRVGALLVLLAATARPVYGQKEMTREEYVATYAPVCIQHQKEYGIPASIKMAQGILESGYGNSDLCRRSNNHFGIKCKTEWAGSTVYHDDDEQGECFRRYDTAEESYRDHSEFLANRPRYAGLFDLDVTDYEGWAHGLKKAGYATAPHYAASLIRIIEEMELYLLDDGDMPSYVAGVAPVSREEIFNYNLATVTYGENPVDLDNYMVSVHSVADYGIFYDNGSRFVVARQGETYESLARKLGVSQRRLLRFNGKDKGASLSPGDMVYIENPNSRQRNNRS